MNKWILLLIVAGLVAAGWLNRDKITDFLGHKGIEVPGMTYTPATPPVGTPNPARDAQAQAAKAYPALLKPGSAFNKKFLALYNQAQQSEPATLEQPNWPVVLAERTARELGGGAMPVGSPTPSRLPPNTLGSDLDPKPKGHGTTPPPKLPGGLQGSALDQKSPKF